MTDCSEKTKNPSEAADARWPNLPVCQTRCRAYRVQMPVQRIGYVNAILEAYEWIARIQTEDTVRGVLRIDVPSDWDVLFRGVMRGLAGRVPLVFLDEDMNEGA